MQVTIGLVVLASIFALLLGFAAMRMALGVLWVSVGVALFAATLPLGWVRYKAQKRWSSRSSFRSPWI